MAIVNFKYGSLAELKNTGIVNGTISVTTDTHSMFVDLNDKRFRLSDFEFYDSIQDLVADSKNWVENSLALVKNASDTGANTVPILAYYDGDKWSNINDTTALETKLTGLITALESQVNTNKGDIANNAASIAANSQAIGDNSTAIAKNANEIGFEDKPQNMTTLWKAIADLTGGSGVSLATLKTAIEKEVKDREDADKGINTSITALSEDVTKNYETKNDATAKLVEAKSYSDGNLKTAKDYSDGNLKTAKSYTDTKVGDEAGLRAAADTATNNRITTLLGEINDGASANEGKSIYEIITKYLVAAGADETLNQLEEIAAWIQSHPGDAADMNLAIIKLQAIVDGIGGENEQATVVDYVTTVKNDLESKITATNGKFEWQPFNT